MSPKRDVKNVQTTFFIININMKQAKYPPKED